MYNPEAIYFNGHDLSVDEFDETTELLDEASLAEFTEEELFEESTEGEKYDESLDIEALLEEEEILFEDESFSEDDLFDEAETTGSIESTPRFLPEQIPLINLVNEVNRETSYMTEAEAAEYLENRSMEFLPALAAALPAVAAVLPSIVSLAPHAINAISSLTKKQPAPKTTPAPVKPKPVTTMTAPAPPAPSVPVPVPTGTSTPDPSQLLKVLTDLIQSPKVLELLSGMLAGKLQGIPTNSGNISGSNILGVISSLAGSLAGGLAKEGNAHAFPEYVISQEGTFVIDPQNAVQEAELILDLIN